MQQPPDSDWPIDAFSESFAFGPFQLLPAQKLVLDGDTPLTIGARAFDLLVALVRRAGDVVGKGELLAQVWPGLTVEEGNLRVHITALRKALGDGQDGRRFIVNSPGRGYSFVAPVLAAPVPRPDHGFPASGDGAKPPGGNLPGAATEMIGRDHLVDLVAASLPQRRFVTITGSGGIGKTTVALAVANARRQSYRDGAYLVDLAPVAEAALVPSALSSALGLPVNSNAPISSLLAVLRDKALLLVLDNCEHVVEAVAALTHEIFRNAPGVHILATSRQPLRVAGEHILRLPPLELPPANPRITAAQALTFAAIRLFAERASELLSAFQLSDADAPVVALICRRLDGIALAIEFAAARVGTLGVRGVADRLNDRFRLLKRGPRMAHSRHQTLRATFDWSYELLPEAAQTVLRRLAVFAGQFTFASAVAVVGGDMDRVDGDEVDIADEFTTLVSASLMAADLAAEPVTYRLLESTRAYALEMLVDSGERALLSRRHAEHFLRLLGDAEAVSSAWSIARWIKMHGHLLDNLRVALDWAYSAEGDAQLGIDLTIAALPLWQRMSLLDECRSRVETALARLSGGDDRRRRLEMQLFAALGNALALHSDAGSTTAWTSALAIADQLGEWEYKLRALRGLWRNAFTSGDSGTARKFAGLFADAAASSGATSLRRVSEYVTGMNLFYAGDLTAARLNIGRAMRASDAASESSDVPRFSLEQTVAASANLSRILWLQGYPDEASRMAERSVEYARSAGHGLSVAYALAWSACEIAIQTGNLLVAEHCLQRLSEQASWDSLGQWTLICRCWTGVLRDRQGLPKAAADLLGAALRDIPEGSFRLHHTRFLGERAHVLGRIGRPLQALEAINKAITLCERLDERWFFAELLRIKGGVILKVGSPGAATSAEEQFTSALDWAKRQGALSWELRAATSLAQLKRGHGKPGEARDLLAPVYGRFAEGFATADLRAAKALLDDLA